MELKNKSIVPRWYQTESAVKAIDRIKSKDVHPILAVPTGAGKTIIICMIIIEWLKQNADKNVLVVSHVREILEQNYEELEDQLDEKIGLYSSGLGRKDTERVTVVGMQSGRNKPEIFKNVGLIIIDECHLVNEYNTGTYRKFLSNFNCNYVGLTATPYRARGYLHLSDESLFTEIAYDLTTYENFNRLTNEGYLSKLYSKATDLKMAIPKGVRTVAGDFDKKDLSILFDNDRVTDMAIKEVTEILARGRYKKVLVFCISIKHSESVADKFNELGFSSNFVHSQMDQDRNDVFDDFRNGNIQVLTNVEVATTGLDIPNIDMVVLLRPTQSISLYVQMTGRGLRVAKGKDHCLVLDFAENVSRLGPINDVKIDQKGKPKGGGEAPVKECPECSCLNHPIAKVCVACGHKFKFEVKITPQASEMSIVKKIEPQRLTVSSVSYARHKKANSADSFRIDYRVGLRRFSKWLAVGSNYYAMSMAAAELPSMLKKGEEVETLTVACLLDSIPKFKTPSFITVDINSKYPEIVKIEYKEDLV